MLVESVALAPPNPPMLLRNPVDPTIGLVIEVRLHHHDDASDVEAPLLVLQTEHLEDEVQIELDSVVQEQVLVGKHEVLDEFC